MALLLTVHVVLTVALLLLFVLVVCVQWAFRRPLAAAAQALPAPVPQAEELAEAA